MNDKCEERNNATEPENNTNTQGCSAESVLFLHTSLFIAWKHTHKKLHNYDRPYSCRNNTMVKHKASTTTNFVSCYSRHHAKVWTHTSAFANANNMLDTTGPLHYFFLISHQSSPMTSTSHVLTTLSTSLFVPQDHSSTPHPQNIDRDVSSRTPWSCKGNSVLLHVHILWPIWVCRQGTSVKFHPM